MTAYPATRGVERGSVVADLCRAPMKRLADFLIKNAPPEVIAQIIAEKINGME
jgi:hypothetical protein